MNIYEQFIEHCRSKEDDLIKSGDYKENHHIKPRHDGGSNDKSNLIFLSRQDHIRAHQYLYIAYQNQKDKIAYLFMIGDPTGEAKRLSGINGQKNRTKEQRSNSAKKGAITQRANNSGIFNRGNSWRNNVSLAASKNIANNRMVRISDNTKKLMKCNFILLYKTLEICILGEQFNNFVEMSKYISDMLGLVIVQSEHKKFLSFIKGDKKSFHSITLGKVISRQA